MDWWKLFSGTFVLIFLAELGDKTQLAALAKTADSPDGNWARWVVFLGASAALVLSTFVAVFLGHILKRLVPDERYIRLAAALLFLVFGFMILYEVFSSFREGKESAAPTAASPEAEGVSFAGDLALRAAIDFESMSVEHYRRIADESGPELGALLREIAREEESHLNRLRNLPEETRHSAAWNRKTPETNPFASVGVLSRGDALALERLIEHEDATAAFYADLAARTLIPSVRTVLARLAGEERSHAARLRRQLS